MFLLFDEGAVAAARAAWSVCLMEALILASVWPKPWTPLGYDKLASLPDSLLATPRPSAAPRLPIFWVLLRARLPLLFEFMVIFSLGPFLTPPFIGKFEFPVSGWTWIPLAPEFPLMCYLPILELCSRELLSSLSPLVSTKLFFRMTKGRLLPI